MSPKESKSGTNLNRVRMFGKCAAFSLKSYRITILITALNIKNKAVLKDITHYITILFFLLRIVIAREYQIFQYIYICNYGH